MNDKELTSLAKYALCFYKEWVMPNKIVTTNNMITSAMLSRGGMIYMRDYIEILIEDLNIDFNSIWDDPDVKKIEKKARRLFERKFV